MAPPFQYQPIQQPFAGTLADLMLRKGQIAADAANRIGAIQAAATQQQGQAWGQAAQGIGQAVAAVPGQMQQQELRKAQLAQAQTQTASGQLDVQAKQRAQAAIPIITKAIQETPMRQVNGVSLYDVPAITKSIADQGYGPEGVQTGGHLDGMNQSFLSAQTATMNAVRMGAAGLVSVGAPPELAHHFIDTLKDNRVITDAEQQQFHQAVDADPGNALKLAQYFAGPQKVTMAKPGETPINDLTGQPVGPQMPPEPKIVPAGGSLVQPGTAGQSPQTVLTMPAATEWGNFKEAFAKSQGVPTWEALSPQQQQAGVERFKLIGPESAQAAATQRQTATINAQIAQQQRGQDFQVQQAGRKELTDKVEQPYQTALASAQTLRDAVAAARSGNKTAAALQSLETTMAAIRAQGLNRINTAEIGVTGNAGSIWDRIQGSVGKFVSGQPVDKSIQKDMEDFAGILEKAARKKYENGWNSITKRYGLSDEQMLPSLPAAGTSTSSGLDPSIDALLKRQ